MYLILKKFYLSHLIGLLIAGSAAAQTAPQSTPNDARAVSGDWSGSYVCNQGITRMALRLRVAGDRVTGLYAFYAHEDNPSVPEGCYEISGTFSAETGEIALRGGIWIKRPATYGTVDLRGVVDFPKMQMSGAVIGFNCGTFSAKGIKKEPKLDAICQEPAAVSFESISKK